MKISAKQKHSEWEKLLASPIPGCGFQGTQFYEGVFWVDSLLGWHRATTINKYFPCGKYRSHGLFTLCLKCAKKAGIIW